MVKKYINTDVFTETQKRLDFIFDEFPNIYVSFSGGKDSGCLLNMAIDKARERHRKIGVLFVDLEAWYKKTIEFIERMINANIDVLDPYWVCLPMESPNSLSFLEPTWIWWDKSKEDIWVRKMPTNKWVINEENNPFDFYKKNMPFESFVPQFGNWFGKGQKTACLIGIRTDESLNRFRAIVADKEKYKDRSYSTYVNNQTYNFYPIYDWRVEDDWTYNGKYHKDYNRLYDLFYKAGVSLPKMRVDEPFGNEAKAGLSLFRVIEPETWKRVANRVSGANFGCIYDGNKIMTARHQLPKNHTWKSYTMFLLSTLPQETAEIYEAHFDKFIKYWLEVGCPMEKKNIDELIDTAGKKVTNTHHYSNRGKGDKEVIRFNEVLDDNPIDRKDDILTWRRMAMCIIKNDICCKSLSFSMTKAVTERQKEIIERYKNI